MYKSKEKLAIQEMNQIMDFITEDKDASELRKIDRPALPYPEYKSGTQSSLFRILPPLRAREISPRYHQSTKYKKQASELKQKEIKNNQGSTDQKPKNCWI